jgi:hypothetical protein
MFGNCGPKIAYEPTYRGRAYGAEPRNHYELHKLYMGMHYKTEDGVNVDSYIKEACDFNGEGVFSKLTERREYISSVFGIVSSPFGNPMKALFRFTLLHCGHTTVFEEFGDANGKVQGIEPVVLGLKTIAKNMRAAEDSEMGEPSETEEQDDALFAKEGGGKKRVAEEGDGETVKNKKVRTDF